MVRYLNYLQLTVGLCLILSASAFPQEDTLAPSRDTIMRDVDVTPSVIPAGAFAAFDDDATLSVKVFRAEVAKGIVEAAEKNPNLTRGEKRRIERIMRGGWLVEPRKQTIITNVIQGIHAEGAIAVTPDGVQAAIDWDQVFLIIEKLIPIVKMFVALLGG